LVKRYHPDSGGPQIDTTKFRKVQQAYETLSDARRRARYDEELSECNKRDRKRYVTRIKPRRSIYRRADIFPRSIIEEFFDGRLFGSRPPRAVGRSEGELAIEMILEPAEARHGGLFPVSVPVTVPCMQCDQSGFQYPFICPNCMGQGRLREERRFSISIPPNTTAGTDVSIPLDDIGLKNIDLHIFIRVEDYGAW
jgi:DnaJ-class molecular chaperone